MLKQLWLTTRDEALNRPFDPIWVRPLDYLNALRGTEYDPLRLDGLPYRRRSEREALVERTIRKLPLLDASNHKKERPHAS